MNIALFNCYSRAVPPQKSGGIETSMDYLIQGLLDSGQKVTLFGPHNSKARPGLTIIDAGEPDIEWRELSDKEKDALNKTLTKKLGALLFEHQDRFDIIHNHCAGVAFPYTVDVHTPVVTTLHEEITPDAVLRLAPYKNKNFVSVSNAQREPYPLNYLETIYYGLPIEDFPDPKSEDVEDFFVCISRISAQKMPHRAIEAAAAIGKQVYIIGAFKDESIESEYFNTQFIPTLNRHSKWATWIKEVDAQTIKSYLHRARALLLPVEFREPGGVAALESMACGCPVVAFNKGVYPETVVDGKTGFIVNSVEEMAEKMRNINTIQRSTCREHIQKNFSVQSMTQNYMNLYRNIIQKHV